MTLSINIRLTWLLKKTERLDYNETYSPMIKAFFVRIVFIVTLYFDWSIRQFDVNNMFLNREL